MPLVEFWQDAVFEDDGYFHVDDNIADNFRGKWVDNFAEYVHLLSIGDDSLQNTYQPYLRPKPYLGSLQTAEVIILLRNPSFNHMNVKFELECPNYVDLLDKNLSQQTDHNFALNPNNAWTPDFMWWEARFRDLANHIANVVHCTYGEALDLLSKKIAFVELEPYRSKGGLNINVLQTASSNNARTWISNRIACGGSVFIQRADTRWKLNIDAQNFGRRRNARARGAYITPASDCGQFILQRLEIPAP